jgi:hypothetical protein
VPPCRFDHFRVVLYRGSVFRGVAPATLSIPLREASSDIFGSTRLRLSSVESGHTNLL